LVKKKSVAVLYGGTFDPPHAGHQKIVDYLVSLEYVDKVIVTPAYLNPFKDSSLASPKQRLKWCRQVFDDPKVIIDPGEVELGHSVYTIDTLKRLNSEYDIAYIAIGSDNLGSIEKWHEFEALDNNVVWLVFERRGYSEGYEKLRRYERISLDEPTSSSYIRKSKTVKDVDKKISKEVETTLKGNK
jgi:nicotinate-nucleotide adenylyltransferase